MFSLSSSSISHHFPSPFFTSTFFHIASVCCRHIPSSTCIALLPLSSISHRFAVVTFFTYLLLHVSPLLPPHYRSTFFQCYYYSHIALSWLPIPSYNRHIIMTFNFLSLLTVTSSSSISHHFPSPYLLIHFLPYRIGLLSSHSLHTFFYMYRLCFHLIIVCRLLPWFSSFMSPCSHCLLVCFPPHIVTFLLSPSSISTHSFTIFFLLICTVD